MGWPLPRSTCVQPVAPSGRESWADAERWPGALFKPGVRGGQESASFPGRYSQAHLLSKVNSQMAGFQ